jgi:hypothetical protein
MHQHDDESDSQDRAGHLKFHRQHQERDGHASEEQAGDMLLATSAIPVLSRW